MEDIDTRTRQRYWDAFHAWEKLFIESEPVDIEKGQGLMDAFFEHASMLRTLPIRSSQDETRDAGKRR
jgi:hypothetical protein